MDCYYWSKTDCVSYFYGVPHELSGDYSIFGGLLIASIDQSKISFHDDGLWFAECFVMDGPTFVRVEVISIFACIRFVSWIPRQIA